MRSIHRSLAALCAASFLGCGHGTANRAPVESAASAVAAPAIQGKEVDYTDGTTAMKGYLVYPADQAARPAVLVVHEWWGLNAYTRSRAEQLAKLGYVALAVDMYGGGRSATHAAEAKQFMLDSLKSADEAKGRFNAAVNLLASDPRVNHEKLAAIGYCYGGGVVMSMARSGADLDLVASFHGAIGTEKPMEKGAFKGKIFIANGAVDPFVPAELVAKVRGELTAADAQFEIVEYPGAKHGFTNPEANALGAANQMSEALAYDAAADAASWQHLTELLSAM
jgi:dienelactone hydrolase